MWTIGLDAHQGLYVLCILDSAGKLIKNERLRGDADVLFKYLRKVPQPFQICYEASCAYGYLYDELQKLARRVVVAHPGGRAVDLPRQAQARPNRRPQTGHVAVPGPGPGRARAPP